MRTGPSPRDGFSLVELAIVLAIVGLLAGGILAGQSMIQTSRVSKTLADAKAYIHAFNTFNEQYGYLPGDMPTATQTWGRADGGTPITSNCAAPATDAANANGTCNGNGDTAISGNEAYRAWQQLGLAGMIGNGYNGTGSATFVTIMVPGPPPVISVVSTLPTTNIPRSAVLNSGFYAFSLTSNIVSAANLFPGNYSSVMMLGSTTGSNASLITGPLSAAEAYGMDMKMDDGKAPTGKVVPSRSSNCVVAATDEYQLDNTVANACALYFLNSFTAK